MTYNTIKLLGNDNQEKILMKKMLNENFSKVYLDIIDTIGVMVTENTENGVDLAVSGGKLNASAKVDNGTIEILDNKIQIKNNGVSKSKINADVAGTNLEQDTDGSLKIKDSIAISHASTNSLTIGSLSGVLGASLGSVNSINIVSPLSYTASTNSLLIDTTPTLKGIQLSIDKIIANYNATKDNHTILCDATDGAFDINLPESSSNIGLVLNIKKIDLMSTNSITIGGYLSEKIDGAPTLAITVPYECVSIQNDGSNWHVLGSNKGS